MSNDKSIQALINELNEETGLCFSLEKGESEDADIALQLQLLLDKVHGKNDRNFFFQQLLVGKISDSDLAKGIKDFHLIDDNFHTIFVVAFKQSYTELEISILSSIFDPSSSELVKIDATSLALIYSFESELSSEELSDYAHSIVDMLESEALHSVHLAYDSCVEGLHNLSSAYHNSVLALSIGRSFFSGENVFSYHDLGLGTLVYQIPKDACIDFLNDNFKGLDLKTLDAETLNTIHTFFDCNLSIAETARELYLHRNTLVYRLDKFKSDYGLDLRCFKDAITIQIGLMLSQIV